jgi:DNA-binding transcriptional ArsR family regulator
VPTLTAIEVLAEPNRRVILDLLREGERPVGDLVAHMALSQPAVSKHLRVMKEAGMVESRIDAQRRLYRLLPQPLMELDAWLAPYRRLWESSLDRLEAHLDRRRPPGSDRPIQERKT